MVNSKLDEQLEFRDELNAKINELEKKLDFLIKHLTIRKMSDDIDSSQLSLDSKVPPNDFTPSISLNEEVQIENKLNHYPNSNIVLFDIIDAKKNWKIK